MSEIKYATIPLIDIFTIGRGLPKYTKAYADKHKGKYPVYSSKTDDDGVFATIPFIQIEYEEAIKWFKDTIKTIELEEEFEPSEDFFYCTNLCNFRHSCEYRKAASRG